MKICYISTSSKKAQVAFNFNWSAVSTTTCFKKQKYFSSGKRFPLFLYWYFLKKTKKFSWKFRPNKRLQKAHQKINKGKLISRTSALYHRVMPGDRLAFLPNTANRKGSLMISKILSLMQFEVMVLMKWEHILFCFSFHIWSSGFSLKCQLIQFVLFWWKTVFYVCCF